jgi:vitamin B12 transporter
LQSSIFNNKLSFTLSAFNRTINDVIIYKFSGYENRDKQHDYGAEAELNYEITSQFNLKLTYDYVDGKITQKLNSKDTSYYNLVRRPKNNIHAFLQFHRNNLTASTSFQLTGERIDTYYDPATFIPRQVDLKSYALINLYAAYSFYKNKLDVFVDAKNLTDNTDYYEVYGFGVTGFNLTGGIRFQF